jgi:LacI family transcriptional regulator
MVLAAEDRGVEIPPAWRISTRLNNQGGRLAAQRLLSEMPIPNAIVCGSDELAIGVMEYLLKVGLQVPDDIVVTGFDGLPHSRSELVGLSTIVQPQIEMAQAAFDMLQERVRRPSAPFETQILPHEIWYGRSCGCPPEHRSQNIDTTGLVTPILESGE